MKNILFILFFLLFTGCLQNSAFLGPAVTVAGTGNIYQAGLSYGSNQVITKITGKTPIENITEILASKNDENKVSSLVKEKIRKTAKIKDLSNQ
jgi:hypothetical protein